MVTEANEKRVMSEKLLKEANGKVRVILASSAAAMLATRLFQIDVLQAEVEALKTLVLTSTPSAPNKHLFPHLTSRNNEHNYKLGT